MLKQLVFLLFSLGLLGCGALAGAPTPTVPPTVTPLPTAAPVANGLWVDTAAGSLGAISPLVYGTNYGPWISVPFDLQEETYTAGLNLLRFPGGNWGDLNTISQADIDSYIELTKLMGAEPMISVRLRGGTAEQAAELVRYTNIEKGYGVRYWSIGNEPSLYPDYDTERYNEEWRLFAEAMLAVDESILLVGPDTHQFTGTERDPKDENGRDWLRAFLASNGDMVDVVAVHRYPFPASMGAGSPKIEDLRANSAEWEQIIPALRAAVLEETGKELPIAITEVNSNWTSVGSGEATPDSHFSALWWGDVMGRLINHQVDMVAHFALYSNPNMGGWGLLARSKPRPSYYVYQLYQQFGEELLAAESAVPNLNIYAARRADGAITVMVINLSDEAQTAPLVLSGNEGDTAVMTLFDAENLATDMGQDLFGSHTYPAQSMTLLVVGGGEE